jgi:hypothetical protein
MMRDLFIAFLFLCLAVTVVAWFGSGPRLNVQTIEADLAK